MQSNTTVSTVNIAEPRRSCSWTSKINKLLVSLDERLNNILVESTIEYNTFPASKFRSKRIQRYLWDREHMETMTKVYVACSHPHMFVACLIACLSYGTSLLAVTCPAKIKRGGHFRVLTGMWVFQNITLHRETNSAKSQLKIRLAFRPTSSDAIIWSKGPINSVCAFSRVWGTGVRLEQAPWVLTSVCYWGRRKSKSGLPVKMTNVSQTKNREMCKTTWWNFVIKITTSLDVIVFFIIALIFS